jgi:isochorismate synthase
LLRPEAGFSFTGVGFEQDVTVGAERRFREAAGAWQNLVAESICDGDGLSLTLPLAFAAFPFTGDAKAGGRLVLPRTFFVQDDGKYWAGASLLVTGATDIEACARSLEGEIGASLAGPLSVAPQCDGVALDDCSGYEAWEESVERVLARIAAGDVEKVVLARQVEGHAERPIQPEPALRRLAERFPAATIFGFTRGDTFFLGASPERLVAMDGGSVSVDCLAGSIARGSNSAADDTLAAQLLGDGKEKHEHEVVVRAIREALAPVVASIEALPEPAIRQTATVQHLFTPVRAQARDGVGILNLVEKLHPTPAVGGYPRDKALRQLAAEEGFDRGWYAGPVGWLDGAGAGDFAVAIRSGLVRGTEVTLYGGSGIVVGSDPRREFEETRLKLQTMSWALGAKR